MAREDGEEEDGNPALCSSRSNDNDIFDTSRAVSNSMFRRSNPSNGLFSPMLSSQKKPRTRNNINMNILG